MLKHGFDPQWDNHSSTVCDFLHVHKDKADNLQMLQKNSLQAMQSKNHCLQLFHICKLFFLFLFYVFVSSFVPGLNL